MDTGSVEHHPLIKGRSHEMEPTVKAYLLLVTLFSTCGVPSIFLALVEEVFR